VEEGDFTFWGELKDWDKKRKKTLPTVMIVDDDHVTTSLLETLLDLDAPGNSA
jgi:hypothetical protein